MVQSDNEMFIYNKWKNISLSAARTVISAGEYHFQFNLTFN